MIIQLTNLISSMSIYFKQRTSWSWGFLARFCKNFCLHVPSEGVSAAVSGVLVTLRLSLVLNWSAALGLGGNFSAGHTGRGSCLRFFLACDASENFHGIWSEQCDGGDFCPSPAVFFCCAAVMALALTLMRHSHSAPDGVWGTVIFKTMSIAWC